jgi:hypothetical protein
MANVSRTELDGLLYSGIKNILSPNDADLVTDELSMRDTDNLLNHTAIKRAYCLHNELNYGYVPVRIPIPKNLIPKDEGGTSQCDEWFKIPIMDEMLYDVEFPDKKFTEIGWRKLVSENVQFLSEGDYVKVQGRTDWGKITRIQYGTEGENNSIMCDYPYTYITPTQARGSTIRRKAPVMKKYGYYEKWIRVPLEEQEKARLQIETMGRSCNAFYETYCANVNKFYNRHLKRNNETFNPDKYFQYESDCACFNYNTAEQGIKAAQELVDNTSQKTGPIHCWMVGCNSLSVRSEYTKTLQKDGQQKKIYTAYIPSDIRHENVAVDSHGNIVTDNASNAITRRDCPKATVCTVNNIIANNDFAGDVGITASMDVNCGGKDKVKREPEPCTMEPPHETGWGPCRCEKVAAPFLYEREYPHGGGIKYWENEETGLQTAIKSDCEKHKAGMHKGKCKKVHKVIHNGYGSTTKAHDVKYPPYKAACPSKDWRQIVSESYESTQQRFKYVPDMNKVFHSKDCGAGVDSPDICPIDANVGPWGRWEKCPYACDGGWHARQRAIIVHEEDGGKPLPTVDENGQPYLFKYAELDDEVDYQVQTKECNQHACICDHHTHWQEGWSDCNAECGGGTQIRWTTVKEPIPANDSNCAFEDELGNQLLWTINDDPPNGNAYVRNIRACNKHDCDADCEMGAWSKWSKCESQKPNTYCGSGIKKSTRKVSKFGAGCGSGYREKPCNLKPCPSPPLTQLKAPSPEKIDYLQRYKDAQEAQLQEMKPLKVPDEEDDTVLFGGLGLALLLCVIVICIMLMYG